MPGLLAAGLPQSGEDHPSEADPQAAGMPGEAELRTAAAEEPRAERPAAEHKDLPVEVLAG